MCPDRRWGITQSSLSHLLFPFHLSASYRLITFFLSLPPFLPFHFLSLSFSLWLLIWRQGRGSNSLSLPKIPAPPSFLFHSLSPPLPPPSHRSPSLALKEGRSKKWHSLPWLENRELGYQQPAANNFPGPRHAAYHRYPMSSNFLIHLSSLRCIWPGRLNLHLHLNTFSLIPSSSLANCLSHPSLPPSSNLCLVLRALYVFIPFTVGSCYLFSPLFGSLT